MKLNREFTIVIEKDEEADMYVGEVVGLSGCHTHGKSMDELMEKYEKSLNCA